MYRISLYDGPHQIQEFLNLKAKHSLSDGYDKKKVLGSEESFGITISNRAGSINLKTDHFELKALDEPLKNRVIIHFIRFN